MLGLRLIKRQKQVIKKLPVQLFKGLNADVVKNYFNKNDKVSLQLILNNKDPYYTKVLIDKFPIGCIEKQAGKELGLIYHKENPYPSIEIEGKKVILCLKK